MPVVKFYENIWLRQLLVCDFIDGRVFQEYTQMSQQVKKACFERVRQLHREKVLHGDLKAPNFIVVEKTEAEVHVFVIDFGRSKILENDWENELESEMRDFVRQMNLPI